MSHSNISIFIPHYGCKCRCSFCNQNYITGKKALPSEEDIDNAVDTALTSKNYQPSNGQIAFFGGSFTAIDRRDMIKYLEIGYKHIKAGHAASIRISTRPDAIDKEILGILKKYGVKSIELGAQSMCDDVLSANNRGHLSDCVSESSGLIKDFGFELGLQMMTGLYKSNDEKDIYTANEFIRLSPDTVRIYPTVVLKNTALEKLYKSGEYVPQSVENAAKIGAVLLKAFFDNNISVIRFGLHTVDKDSFVAGAFHPALAELANSDIYYSLIKEKLSKKGFYTVFTAQSELSKAIGQHRTNISKFENMGFFIQIKPCDDLKKYEIRIEKGQ